MKKQKTKIFKLMKYIIKLLKKLPHFVAINTKRIMNDNRKRY